MNQAMKANKKTGKYMLSRFVKSLDLYGHPISLSFKGETTHKTLLGGVFTILANVLVLSFLIYQILSVVSNTPIINNSYLSRDLTNDPTIITMNHT
jgi:hypothetical protein